MGTKIIPVKAKSSLYKPVMPIIERTGYGELLCYEGTTGRWFRSSKDNVTKWVNNANTMIQEELGLCINELINNLGLYPSTPMYEYGWRAKDLILDTDLFKMKYYESGFKGMEEPVLSIYTTSPAIKGYYKEELDDGV